MGRTPCCEKVGLKRGPWTPQEDQILIHYITHNGHGNWRALPKSAGLLRCGKSCRLRWVNYLRPGIKRGNFTAAEEDTILKLHRVLGNKWSVIAARLPGRTDNEIKNVWNTYLKKRAHRKSHPLDETDFGNSDPLDETDVVKSEPSAQLIKYGWETNTRADSSSENSGSTSAEAETEQSFWSEVFSDDDLSAPRIYYSLVDFPYDLNMESGDDFWPDIFYGSE